MPNAYICDPSECARLNKNDAFIFKTRKITHNFMRKILQPSKCSRSVPMHFSSPIRNASNSKAISTPMFLTSFDDVEFFFWHIIIFARLFAIWHQTHTPNVFVQTLESSICLRCAFVYLLFFFSSPTLLTVERHTHTLFSRCLPYEGISVGLVYFVWEIDFLYQIKLNYSI